MTCIRADLHIRTDEISKLLIGNYGSTAKLAFVLLSIGSFLLAYNIREKNVLSIRALLIVYALCVLLAGFTEPQSVVHTTASLVAFTVLPVSIVLAARHGRRNDYWWFVAIILSIILWPIVGFGIGERLTVYTEVGWLLIMTLTSGQLSLGKAQQK